jgi:hypothetical protein
MFIRTNWMEGALLVVGFTLAYPGTFFDLVGSGERGFAVAVAFEVAVAAKSR